ncbi:MAG: serine hydrolase [Candidatus Paceibacterota bacterium]|jgi:D-alanyl-D-alanine endopeptidase (penicillin-binding protein 7)
MPPNNFKKIFNKENRTKYFVHVLSYLFIFSILIFSLMIIGENALNKEVKAETVQNPDFFQDISLEAKAVMVWDVINNRELFSKNPDTPLPLASLTKVMTAVTLNGKLENNQKIKITSEDLLPEGDSKLVVGDTWEAQDLRDFTLLTSSNDGAFALAAVAGVKGDSSFIKEMNDIASKIGLSNSKFFNEHGLDTQVDRGGAYGSARDMTTLFQYTLKNYPEILEATRYKNLQFESSQKTYPSENTNTIIDQIPNIIASKTGYTDLAGGNLVVAFDAGLNRPIIISVLGSSEEGRFTDVLKLMQASVEYINQ